MAADSVEVVGNTPGEFAVFIKSETVKWAAVVKNAGITPDEWTPDAEMKRYIELNASAGNFNPAFALRYPRWSERASVRHV